MCFREGLVLDLASAGSVARPAKPYWGLGKGTEPQALPA